MGEKPGTVELAIASLAGGGRGVARKDGKVWMVEGAVPGDRVLAVPLREKPRLVEGRTVRILERSDLRREPACHLQDSCGGCPWMVLDEDQQREWKGRVVRDSLERIARLSDPPVEQVVASPRDLAYRGKVEFSMGSDEGGRTLIGFRHRLHPEKLVDVDDCKVLPAVANGVLREVRKSLGARSAGGAVGQVGFEGGRLVLRHSVRDDNVLVIFRSQGREWSGLRPVVQRLGSLAEVAGVVALTGLPGRRGGVRSRVLAGRDHLMERLGGTLFKVPAATFFQVNPGAAAILVDQVVAMAGALESGTPVLDLYGGVGLFAWALATQGAQVTVCEADPHAVTVGREGIGSPRRPNFVCDDAGRYLDRVAGSRPVRVVVANPPRTGFGAGVGRKIAALEAERLIVVSCDPGTLARDLKQLMETGYELQRVVPVDLFPQTAHVETVSLLVKGRKGA